LWYLVFVRARNTSPAKRVSHPKFQIKREGSRTVRDRACLALCAVGAGARARVPGSSGTLLRARCVRKGCMHRHIVRGGCWGTRDCPQHTHCGWWVLGQARVFSALGQARARAAYARVARELAANASIACRVMTLQSALSLTPVCWASAHGCAWGSQDQVATGREPRQRNRTGPSQAHALGAGNLLPGQLGLFAC
jgi:hypothetical protein